MGLAAISITSTTDLLLAPWHALVGFFAPWQNDAARVATAQPGKPSAPGHEHGPVKASGMNHPDSEPGAAMPVAHAGQRLRVLRVVDTACPPQSAGRMVISGRMADVCAELERMTQGESQRKERPQLACAPRR